MPGAAWRRAADAVSATAAATTTAPMTTTTIRPACQTLRTRRRAGAGLEPAPAVLIQDLDAMTRLDAGALR
jgi:hypothetical protein